MPQSVRGQQSLREGATWEQPAEAKERDLLRATGSKSIAKETNTEWGLWEGLEAMEILEQEKEGGKYALQKYAEYVSFIII